MDSSRDLIQAARDYCTHRAALSQAESALVEALTDWETYSNLPADIVATALQDVLDARRNLQRVVDSSQHTLNLYHMDSSQE